MPVHPPVTRRPPAPHQRTLHLLVLLVPTGLLAVVLKVLRVPAEADLGGVVVQTTSDLAFGAGWTLAWLAACLRPRSPLARTTALVLAHLATAALAVLTVVYHVFQQRTGSTLTVRRLQSSWEQRAELSGLVGSQLDGATLTLLAAAVVMVLVLPWLVAPPLARLFARVGRPRALVVAQGARRHLLRATAVLAAGFLLASLWTAPTSSARFARAPVTNLVMTPVDERSAFRVELDEDQPAPAPAATSLQGGSERQRNVVVITLESQRPTSTLPPTDQPVTPFLDELAERSITAERAYAVVPHTSKSLTAIHCGVTPPLDTRNSEAEPDGIAARCLPELLREQGYRTAFFQSATEHFERRRDLVANFGFETFHSADTLPTEGFAKANYFGYEDDVMLAPSREWVTEQAGAPFLLSYLTVTAHHDYALPDGFAPVDFVADPELNDYLNGLRYQDRFVRKVVEQFQQLGLYEDTVFVVVGDHGEGFGEHGSRQHDNTIHEEGIRVPLLLHDPQRTSPVLVEEPVQQTAVLATVADVLGFEVDGGGHVVPSLLSEAEREPITVTCAERARCMARLSGDLKYVHHFGDRRDEVYDLSVDPGETHDLVTGTDREWLAEQREETLRWRLRVERMYRELRAGGDDPTSVHGVTVP